MTYPNGRVINYNYASGLDNTIGRLSSISDSSATLESYSYLGLSTVVARNHPQSGVNLTYISTGTGDAGDHYTGLDRFGRVVDQDWTNGTTDVDRYQYGYDPNGNVQYKDNLVSTSNSELYTYDDLNRLTTFNRGTLTATKDGLNGTASLHQAWYLDAVGNWSDFGFGYTIDIRSQNAQNQTTEAFGNTVTFDANGNTTTDQSGKHFVYDAWNRLATVKDASNAVIASYAYDATGRRSSEGSADLYVSMQDQVLEERAGATTTQYVWSPVYVNALIERDQGSQRLYVAQDANWNVTALIGTDGLVKERFQYTPYGTRTVLAANWTATSDAYGFAYAHQGGRADPVTGLIHFQARDFNPALGTWMQPDAEGYIDGMSRYQFVQGNPVNRVDPNGLDGFGGNDPHFNVPRFPYDPHFPPPPAPPPPPPGNPQPYPGPITIIIIVGRTAIGRCHRYAGWITPKPATGFLWIFTHPTPCGCDDIVGQGSFKPPPKIVVPSTQPHAGSDWNLPGEK